MASFYRALGFEQQSQANALFGGDYWASLKRPFNEVTERMDKLSVVSQVYQSFQGQPVAPTSLSGEGSSCARRNSVNN